MRLSAAAIAILGQTLPLAAQDWALPPTAGGVDYQLGGTYAPDPRVAIVARDSTAGPSPGLYNICYVNGFQTQPGTLDWWLAHHPGALLRGADGALVADPAWPDEYALDTRSAASRSGIAQAVGLAVERCAAAGFDAVEFDNLDSWTRFEGLAVDGNLSLAALLIEKAHGLGMAAGQKNAPDLGERGPRIGFDFVISEECAAWDECGAYAAHYGARHIDIEYEGALPSGLTFPELCGRADQPRLTVLRDRLLRPPGDAGHTFALCE